MGDEGGGRAVRVRALALSALLGRPCQSVEQRELGRWQLCPATASRALGYAARSSDSALRRTERVTWRGCVHEWHGCWQVSGLQRAVFKLCVSSFVCGKR